jgi:cell division protein FtsI (penicillin-binding protein 3)
MNPKVERRERRRPVRRRHVRSKWTRLSRRRSVTIFALGGLIWALILSRLFFIQILKGEEYKQIARGQQRLNINLEAKRGTIYDRSGSSLVINLPVESFFAIPESVTDKNQVAATFSSSKSSLNQIKEKLKTKKNFVWLKRKVEKKDGQRIKQSKLDGVWAKYETKRYNLYGDLAEEVLGFTDIDNRGLAGVEFRYDQCLRGKDGKGVFQRDGHRNSYRISECPVQQPEDGNHLVLTIDIELQGIVEQELKEGIQQTRAGGGSAIFMNPVTGEILAMAYCGKDDGLPVKNRTISDSFEPGSTFKIVTAAAALEEQILSPEDSIFAEEGSFKIGRRTIHDVKERGWLSFKEGVMYSSNIALAKTAILVGKDKIHQYALAFGMGQKTGVDLPGEASGFLSSPKRWSDFVLSCTAFGQGISLTALQLACAYCAVANHGVMMKPFVVKAILDENGDTLKTVRPTVVRRVISEGTAHLLVDFLTGVVSSGSGQRAKMEGMTIGGKTGTAQKAKPGGRGYDQENFIASFIGFFPAEDPRVVGLITLDSPQEEHLGGLTAAPVFKNTAHRILSLARESLLLSSAKTVLSIASETLRSSEVVGEMYQYKPESTDIFAHPDTTAADGDLIPDVRGLTAREAVRVFTARDLQVTLKGSGIVVDQVPGPNAPVSKDRSCVIKCRPR